MITGTIMLIGDEQMRLIWGGYLSRLMAVIVKD